MLPNNGSNADWSTMQTAIFVRLVLSFKLKVFFFFNNTSFCAEFRILAVGWK